MKIAWVTTLYYPRTDGVAKFGKIVCEELVKKKIDVVVHTLRYDSSNPKEETINGVKIFRHDFFSLFDYRYSPEMYKSLMNEKDVDIIHAHQWGFYPLSCAAKVAKKRRIPLIFNSYYHPPVLGGFIRKIKRKIFNLIENKKIFRSSSLELAITSIEKRQLLDLGAKNVKVIHLPIDTEKYINYNWNRSQILFCGTLAPIKGIDKFLFLAKEIHKRWPEQKITVLGKGSYCFDKKDYPFIEFKQDLTEKDLIAEFNKSLMLVSPTLYESFGLIIAENMSCGTPVISIRTGGVKEVVGNAGMLYNYSDWKKMIQGIQSLRNYNFNKKMGILAREQIVKNFDKGKIITSLINVYKSFMKTD